MSALGETLELAAEGGIEATILPYGATLQSLRVPCVGGARQVLANYPVLSAYQNDAAYVGCIIGRVANRIGDARLDRHGQTFPLSDNENGNTLHGGAEGFNRRTWTVTSQSQTRIELTYLSPDGDQGFPGALSAMARFELVDAMTLRIGYAACGDRETPVDLTHHLYFNLGGKDGDLAGHGLRIHADDVLELDHACLPTGRRLRVDDTPFDCTRLKPLGSLLEASHPQLTPIGLNQAWVLSGQAPALTLRSPDSRLELEVDTDQACMQIYSGLDHGVRPGGALAIEPQGFIGAANNRRFPSPWLAVGQRYERYAQYRFFSR